MPEYLDVVDENDNIIGKATRSEVHSTGKIHRAVHVFVFNFKGELLLELRPLSKKQYPGQWCDVCGHVGAGESYEEAAKKELKEEIGVECELRKFCDLRKRYKNDNENIRLFLCQCDGPFKINPKEVERIEFFGLEQIKKDVETGKKTLTPGTLLLFKEYCKRTGK
jgi:isopentenyl-diphosphate delta-isomerase type 1